MAVKSHVYRSTNVRAAVLVLALLLAIPILALGVQVVRVRRISDALTWIGLLGFTGLLLWRLGRAGVVVEDGQVRVRNFMRTWHLRAVDIQRFFVAPNNGLPAAMAYAKLCDGRIVKLEGIGTSQFMIAEERLSLQECVERLNHAIGVGVDDRSSPDSTSAT